MLMSAWRNLNIVLVNNDDHVLKCSMFPKRMFTKTNKYEPSKVTSVYT